MRNSLRKDDRLLCYSFLAQHGGAARLYGDTYSLLGMCLVPLSRKAIVGGAGEAEL